ncbi:MAG: fatty acid desaturase family protein [Chitinophagales bacterium]
MHTAANKNIYLIIETIFIFILISIAAVVLQLVEMNKIARLFLYIPLLLFQGLWFYRFYIVGHEAAHKKLFRNNVRLNDFWGSVILLPLMTPITIYRKIHYFHHGFNRKDDHTSALDTFVIKGKPTLIKRLYFQAVWYISTFCGGFFIHSLISVILFLFIPPKLSVKISPAFKNWTVKDQCVSILLFLLGVGLHLGIFFLLGREIYLYTLGFPMLSFAWILSLLVYIFHYDTTKGDEVRYNVRSVKRIPVFSWILMNFNEHATHHQFPNIPWYELPNKRQPLPEVFDNKNQTTRNFFKAIINQLKGPAIIYEHKD